LIAIGERFGVAVDELKVKNKLASDKIKAGQRLRVAAVTTSSTAPGT